MAPPRPRIEAWPLLPRTANGGPRRDDEPAEAVITTLAGVAALLLLLRWSVPGAFAREVTALIALWGGLGSFALVTAIMALLVGAAAVAPVLAVPDAIKEAGLATFDHAVHLAFVLTAAGLLGTIVLHGRVPGIAVWFAGQGLALWGCHRMRLWLARRSAA